MLGKHSLASNPALCKALLWHRSPHTAALGGCVPISEVPNHSSRGVHSRPHCAQSCSPCTSCSNSSSNSPGTKDFDSV